MTQDKTDSILYQSPSTPNEVYIPTVKVKVFYSFNGSNLTCLCTFNIPVTLDSAHPWPEISLKRCLMAICTSSSDMFLTDADCAVYSVNYQEERENMPVWEGHGLLSWILEDEKQLLVSNKVFRSTDEVEHIEVTLQLSRTSRITKPEFYQSLLHSEPCSPSNLRRVISLPSMPDPAARPMGNSVSTPNIATVLAARHLRRISDRLPPIVVALHSENDIRKRGRSPVLSTGKPNSHTSPTLILPLPSALLELSQKVSSYPNTFDNATVGCGNSSSSAMLRKTHAAVGRRKKRDTKPPNTNDIRTFIQVEKDNDGNYQLPVEIDSWTVCSLGVVVHDRPAFHNQRYIYPVGYKVKKWYRSMVDSRSDTQYVCEILDGDQEPVFRLEAEDNPGEVYMGPTPTTVWTIAVRRAFAIRNMEYGHNPVGPDFFGLRKNTIAKMIQDLPGADKCKNYTWQTFKEAAAGRSARGRIFRIDELQSSPSECIKSPNTKKLPQHTTC